LGGRAEELAGRTISASATVPPHRLKPDELNEFRRLCRTLEGMRLLSEPDLDMIETLARHRAEAETLRRTLDRKKNRYVEKKVARNKQQYFVKHPELVRLEVLEVQILRETKELGLTPAARGGMTAQGGKGNEQDERSKLFSRG
jgi:P27 family predicted phage terminase small subunit